MAFPPLKFWPQSTLPRLLSLPLQLLLVLMMLMLMLMMLMMPSLQVQ